MSIGKKLIAEAVERYGLDSRAYEYDTEFNWVVVWRVLYDDRGEPIGVRKIATLLPESNKPPVAQLSFRF
jgi:hypothetical protein